MAGCGRVRPLPWLRGGMLHGATSPEASPACWRGLCPTRLHAAAPCSSALPAHPCSLLPISKQPSDGSIPSLDSQGLGVPWDEEEKSFVSLANSTDNGHPCFGAHLIFPSLLAIPGCCPQAFISAVLSKLALLGATACFVLSGVGLTNGPLCFYNASQQSSGLGTLWGYPFLDSGSQEPDRTENYLYNPHTWSTCLEPAGIVVWNVVLFSLLLLFSAAEMVLASLQILNGCLGFLCGFCEGK
ncbi:transmembrane 4 L6 family member 19 isoform X1 [Cuculus canorus]|uniref:transmembrane 4 L6 family member 19 isoform X1 n=1 Tax=Cuculus canorus TaxID=55661 RepID=UPI0023AA6DB5|nr:transmembrane 4 L6 family member 19 isoform X1 [Cuculus canorus]